MTKMKEIVKDRRYREFRRKQLMALRRNEDKHMFVPEHVIWNSLLEHIDDLKTEENLMYFRDGLVDIANLCLLCHMSIEGFKGCPE